MTSFPPSRLLLQRSPPAILVPPTFSSPSPPPRSLARLRRGEAGGAVARGWLLPVDPWAPAVDSESIASQLFALSLFPYLGFLYFLTKSKSAPSLTLFGFYFLLAFVGATIPAGIYAKVQYGTSLSNESKRDKRKHNSGEPRREVFCIDVRLLFPSNSRLSHGDAKTQHIMLFFFSVHLSTMI
ncbi:hypothetical protein NL676_010055 [Syzygium grande]|nr:hypothetical protein NL676_010055 [Syzygium grande]